MQDLRKYTFLNAIDWHVYATTYWIRSMDPVCMYDECHGIDGDGDIVVMMPYFNCMFAPTCRI